jgi:hypothetical protein
MTNAGTRPTQGDAWIGIEKEKRLDRLVRKACIIAWAVTLGLLVLFAIGIAAPVVQMMKIASGGGVPWITVVGSAMPLFGMLWTVSLLVATLTTVGVFLRLRTASLSEIQLRLAMLEEMLSAQAESQSH